MSTEHDSSSLGDTRLLGGHVPPRNLCPEPVANNTKRLMIDLNAEEDQSLDEETRIAGGKRIVVTEFGAADTSKELL